MATGTGSARALTRVTRRRWRSPGPGPTHGPMTTLHDFTLKTIDGQDKSLKDFEGQVCLVVNVASKCGLTPQYEGLQKLHDSLEDRGFAVLGFPCNQFGGQEPGSEAEIKSFCESKFGVTFPMFSKIDVKGANQAPLYKQLTEAKGEVKWNFTKFLVGKDGKVLAKFDSGVAPDAEELRKAIDDALAAPAK